MEESELVMDNQTFKRAEIVPFVYGIAKMKKEIMVLFAFLFSVPMFAQVDVKGQIVDGADKAIEFVTVIAVEDSTGVVADENGVFDIKVRNADVRLAFSHVSYENLTIRTSVLSGNLNSRSVSLMW